MIGLLQRVTEASVEVDGNRITGIGPGLLVLVCAQRGDSEAEAERLLDRILKQRIFSDVNGKMNLNLRDVGGGMLLVPQFTLAADTSRGSRPGFSRAAAASDGEHLFDYLLARAEASHSPVAGGRFGSHMRVSPINDGPVTLWLQVSAPLANKLGLPTIVQENDHSQVTPVK